MIDHIDKSGLGPVVPLAHTGHTVHAVTVPHSTWRLPAALLAVQTAVLLVLAGLLVVSGAIGGTGNAGRAITEGFTVLALAACSGFLAVGFERRRSAARTPSLLWNALVVIVGITLATSGAPVIGVVAAAVGAATFLASLRVPRYDLSDDA